MNADEFDEAFDLGSDLMDSLDLLTESRMNALSKAIKQAPTMEDFGLISPATVSPGNPATSSAEFPASPALPTGQTDRQTSQQTSDNSGEEDVPLLDSMMQVSMADFDLPHSPASLQPGLEPSKSEHQKITDNSGLKVKNTSKAESVSPSNQPACFDDEDLPTQNSSKTPSGEVHQATPTQTVTGIISEIDNHSDPDRTETSANSAKNAKADQQKTEHQEGEKKRADAESSINQNSADQSLVKSPQLSPTTQLVDFPAWMIESLDQEANRLGVTRDAIIKIWIAERLDHYRSMAR